MAYIELHYGPYLESGIIKHRTNRIMNLYKYYQKRGNAVELVPTINYDCLEVVAGLRIVFQCKLTFLSQLNYEVFGAHHDPTFLKAIKVVDEFLSRVGHIGPNIKVPGIYKEMFDMFQNYESIIVHNNYPWILSEVAVEGDDYNSSGSSLPDTSVEQLSYKKGIKFTNY